jgi:hypothetical protein
MGQNMTLCLDRPPGNIDMRSLKGCRDVPCSLPDNLALPFHSAMQHQVVQTLPDIRKGKDAKFAKAEWGRFELNR